MEEQQYHGSLFVGGLGETEKKQRNLPDLLKHFRRGLLNVLSFVSLSVR